MCTEIITIGNYTVTGYGLCLALAIIAAYFTTDIGIKYYKLDSNVVLPMVASAVIPGFIGAKALYLLQISDYLRAAPSIITDYITDGFVIYGGIIVAIPSVYICLKLMKVDILQYMDIGIAAIAIAQAIGRFGCFLAGCCYGERVEAGSFLAVTYPDAAFAPNGYSYFPIQLVCVVLNLLNFVFLIALNKQVDIKGVTLSSYMVAYGIGRFIIEFFRGDDIRGYVGQITTSQFISLFVIAVGIICIIICVKKHKEISNKTKNNVIREGKIKKRSKSKRK